MVRENQGDWATGGREAAERARIVLGNAFFEAITRRADVIATIGTLQDVKIRAVGHGPPSSFETRSSGPLLRMRAGLASNRMQQKEVRTPTGLILRSPPTL